MRRKLIIDLDSERKATIKMGPIKTYENEEVKPNPVLDMGILCEGICTLIHLCHQEKIQKDSDSLRACIKHLKDGFSEAGYKAYMPEEAKTEYENQIEKCLCSYRGPYHRKNSIVWERIPSTECKIHPYMAMEAIDNDKTCKPDNPKAIDS